jgi:hypothetical protein
MFMISIYLLINLFIFLVLVRVCSVAIIAPKVVFAKKKALSTEGATGCLADCNAHG